MCLQRSFADICHRDDPVDKYLPDFSYVEGGWADFSAGSSVMKSKEPITIRQLAGHMAGLTREYPRGDMKDWPHSLEGLGPPPLNGCPFPTTKETIEGLAKYPLVVPTYSYPVYSNAGMAILGQVAVAANAAFEKSEGITDPPSTWKALVQRDIFDSLGLNGSSFIVTPENKAHVAVAAVNSDEVVSKCLSLALAK
jgi:CubicO group peptidase (beta-lactamase class C family)